MQLSAKPRGMGPEARAELFARLQAKNPAPRTELEYSDVFQLLIAVMLSAQATDISVNKATRALFAQAGNPTAMLALGVEGLIPYIRSIGLHKTKAKHLIQTCQALLDQHQGQVPAERAALEALPGVGRKTANVVLNSAFGQPTMAVDTHIFRVSNRMGLAPGKNVREVEDALLKRIPKNYLQHAHHWLILHGRYTCKARKPQCGQCPLVDLCKFPNKT